MSVDGERMDPIRRVIDEDNVQEDDANMTPVRKEFTRRQSTDRSVKAFLFQKHRIASPGETRDQTPPRSCSAKANTDASITPPEATITRTRRLLNSATSRRLNRRSASTERDESNMHRFQDPLVAKSSTISTRTGTGNPEASSLFNNLDSSEGQTLKISDDNETDFNSKDPDNKNDSRIHSADSNEAASLDLKMLTSPQDKNHDEIQPQESVLSPENILLQYSVISRMPSRQDCVRHDARVLVEINQARKVAISHHAKSVSDMLNQKSHTEKSQPKNPSGNDLLGDKLARISASTGAQISSTLRLTLGKVGKSFSNKYFALGHTSLDNSESINSNERLESGDDTKSINTLLSPVGEETLKEVIAPHPQKSHRQSLNNISELENSETESGKIPACVDVPTLHAVELPSEQSARGMKQKGDECLNPLHADDDEDIETYALLLYELFHTFCRPPPSFEMICSLLSQCKFDILNGTKSHGQDGQTKYQINSNHLTESRISSPRHLIVGMGESTTSVIRLLCLEPEHVLFNLPTVFTLCFFRMLNILLSRTSNDDNVKTRQMDEKKTNAQESQGRVPFGTRKDSKINFKAQFDPLQRPQRLMGSDFDYYSIVRFRCGSEWRRFEESNCLEERSGAITVVRRLLRFLVWRINQSLNQNKCTALAEFLLLTTEVSRLLSCLSVAGISTRDLSRMLDFLRDPIPGEEVHTVEVISYAQLLTIQSLEVAAQGDINALTSGLRGSIVFDHVFSFSGVQGLSLPQTKPAWPWPFRYDFGVALWLRAEPFESSLNLPITILSTKANNGTEIEIQFRTLATSSKCTDADLDRTVATLCVLVRDCQDLKLAQRTMKLKGHVILSGLWYHLAIRLTTQSYRGYFSAPRDEISIFVNGKLVLSEVFGFPKCSLNLSTTKASLPDPGPLIERFEFARNFVGQTSGLYVFKEFVSNSLIAALFECGKEQPQEEDLAWDSHKSTVARKLNTISQNVSSDYREVSISKNSSMFMRKDDSEGTSSNFLDVISDDYGAEDFKGIQELSNLGSKTCLVWDPRRVKGSIGLEMNIGGHALMNFDHVSVWKCTRADTVILSLGGIQSLISAFQMVLQAAFERTIDRSSEVFTQLSSHHSPSQLLPHLFYLLAAFIRRSADNAREILRCGGIEMIELWISDQKSKFSISRVLDSEESAGSLLDSLLHLRSSSFHNLILEAKICSRLLFNPFLWIGDSNAFELRTAKIFLPFISSIAKRHPNKVRDCVDTRVFVSFIKKLVVADNDPIKDSSTYTPEIVVLERQHLIDSTIGTISLLLLPKAPIRQVRPVLNFLTDLLDHEWEFAAQLRSENKLGKRLQEFEISVKLTTVLLYLLEKRPCIPQLFESLESILGGPNGMTAWIVCCVVNSFDESIRSLGIRCLAAYLDGRKRRGKQSDIVHDYTVKRNVDVNPTDLTAVKTSKVAKSAATIASGLSKIGTGISAANSSPESLSRMNDKITFKLLWHLLKCHRECLGDESHGALLRLLMEDSAPINEQGSYELVTNDDIFPSGFVYNNRIPSYSRANVAETSKNTIMSEIALGTILRLLRFLSSSLVEQWLSDLLLISRANDASFQVLISCAEWQPCLYLLLSQLLDNANQRFSIRPSSPDLREAMGERHESGIDISFGSQQNEQMEFLQNSIDGIESPYERCDRLDSQGGNDFRRSSSLTNAIDLVGHESQNRCFDLCTNLYSTLLGNLVRQGGDRSYQMVEQAASLQRICVNGQEVFAIILSHLIEELTNGGTVANLLTEPTATLEGRSQGLKRSASVVTSAILSNGTSEMDLTTAVKHWRCLRHLTAVIVGVVTTSGFGVCDLLRPWKEDYLNHERIGILGAHLPDGALRGLTASATLTGFTDMRLGAVRGTNNKEGCRIMCLVLSSQILSLLDAFIFPDSLDTSLPAAQLHGLALVRSTEPRLGQSQGPLLASLLRLSLILLTHLEPSGVKFLQCCGRLRCFLHWTLELIRESVALGGYSAAFQELTAPFDHLVLSVVLQCHVALTKCATFLESVEMRPARIQFNDQDEKQKHVKRLFRAANELREMVIATYRGRNEVLRAALSLKAYDCLQSCLGEMIAPGYEQSEPRIQSKSSKEASLRKFLASAWVQGFSFVETRTDGLPIPEQIANGQIYKGKTASTRGIKAVEELAVETKKIIKEFNRALDKPFELYCEDQRQWAETKAVRELENEGNILVKKLSQRHKRDINDEIKLSGLRRASAIGKWNALEHRRATFLFEKDSMHWKMSKHSDLRRQHFLMVKNVHFESHEEASYELMLGREREEAQKARRERDQRKLSEAMLKKASVAFYKSINETDIDTEENDLGPGVIAEKEVDDNLTGSDGGSTAVDSEALNSDKVKDERQNPDHDQDTEDANSEASGPKDEINWARTFIWAEREQEVYFSSDVLMVTLRSTFGGQLLLTTHSIYFHQVGDELSVMTGEKLLVGKEKQKYRRWRLSRLSEVHGRRYLLRPSALELFFVDSKEIFLNFNEGTRARDMFFAKLRSNCKVPLKKPCRSLNPRVVFKRSKVSELWRKRKISNYDYLMQLNVIAGRSFNDITQYPVFPWILADFTSKKLDLDDPSSYRDLSKPVGALDEERLSMLIERYNELDCFREEEKFLFGSHYSSPGVVLYYMLRQEPYTSMHIELQSGRFDVADRIFFDMASCWRCCLKLTSDVKELIPEFFTSPEIFMNTNSFPLGKTQNGVTVDDVTLPPWAKGSAHEFVRLHRLALESEFVSQNLHKWIDLIFGYKQRGPEAAKAHNIFHFLSYEGAVDLDTITDDIDRKATESHIKFFGQTPSQLLLKEPHPPRYSSDECWKPIISSTTKFSTLQCWMPSKQFGSGSSAGAIISIHTLTEQIVAIYEDLSVGTYKLTKSSGRISSLIKPDKLRALGSRRLSLSTLAVAGRLSTDEPQEIAHYRAKVLARQLEHGTVRAKEPAWNSCFGVTIGGLIKETLLRKSAASGTRSVEGSAIMDSAFSLISCAYNDGTIKMHSIDGLRLKCSTSGGHRGAILCLEIGSCGALMVTGGEDATCRVWVVDYPDLAFALTDAYVQTELGNFDEGGQKQLLTCCHVLWGHLAPVECLSFNSDLDIVVSGSAGGRLCLHKARNGKFIRTMSVCNIGKPSSIRILKLCYTGCFVAYSESQSLHLCTVNGVELYCAETTDALNALQISSDGQMLISGGEKCEVVVRSMKNLQVISVLDLKRHGPIRCLALTSSENNPSSQLLCVGSNDGIMTVVDVDHSY